MQLSSWACQHRLVLHRPAASSANIGLRVSTGARSFSSPPVSVSGSKQPRQRGKKVGPVQAQAVDATNGIDPERGIIERELHDEATTSYLSYAMSVMVGRALPDARDGLKPVHRRVLHAMQELGLVPSKPFRKSARVVGEVLGKYHPHGDQAVYDSLVRMAQPHAMSEPLVNGHGNFGSIDNDPAAAMRYTECRLQSLASDMLLADLDPTVVDYVPNFDDSVTEPSVMPARLPQLLLNGSQGIAVGIATKIPPHNLSEIVAAMNAVIDDPEISTEALMALVPGPDFPTGGQLISGGGIESAYREGKGSMIMRATTHVESQKRGAKGSDREVIVVTELPYQVPKAALIGSIADLVEKGVIVGVSDIRDESDRTGMRIAIEVKRSSTAAVVLNNLLIHSRLQTRFAANMVALVRGAPAVLTLRDFLQVFIDFRLEVLTKRTQARLDDRQARHHIVSGFLVAVDNLDDVVRVIRSADDGRAAKDALMTAYSLSSEQTDAVLNMSLRRLTSLAIGSLVTENAALVAEISDLIALLADKPALLAVMKAEASELDRKYGRKRRTIIADSDVAEKVTARELVTDEKGLVIVSTNGYIKRVLDSSFTTQKRGGRGKSGGRTRMDDSISQVLTVMSHDDLVCVTTMGRAFKISAYDIPECSRTALGAPLPELIPKMGRDVSLAAILPLRTYDASESLVLMTKGGRVKRIALSDLQDMRQDTKVIGCKEGDELCFAATSAAGDAIMVASSSGKTILFDADSVREQQGRGARGVLAMKMGGAHVVGATIVGQDDKGASSRETGPWVLFATSNGLGKRVAISEFNTQARGGSGCMGMKLVPGSTLASVAMVYGSGAKAVSECLVTTSAGNISRIRLDEFKVYGRAAKGVKIVALQGDANTLVSATPCQYDHDSDTSEESTAEE